MASKEQRQAAIKRAAEMVRDPCNHWLKRASESSKKKAKPGA